MFTIVIGIILCVICLAFVLIVRKRNPITSLHNKQNLANREQVAQFIESSNQRFKKVQQLTWVFLLLFCLPILLMTYFQFLNDDSSWIDAIQTSFVHNSVFILFIICGCFIAFVFRFIFFALVPDVNKIVEQLNQQDFEEFLREHKKHNFIQKLVPPLVIHEHKLYLFKMVRVVEVNLDQVTKITTQRGYKRGMIVQIWETGKHSLFAINNLDYFYIIIARIQKRLPNGITINGLCN